MAPPPSSPKETGRRRSAASRGAGPVILCRSSPGRHIAGTRPRNRGCRRAISRTILGQITDGARGTDFRGPMIHQRTVRSALRASVIRQWPPVDRWTFVQFHKALTAGHLDRPLFDTGTARLKVKAIRMKTRHWLRRPSSPRQAGASVQAPAVHGFEAHADVDSTDRGETFRTAIRAKEGTPRIIVPHMRGDNEKEWPVSIPGVSKAQLQPTRKARPKSAHRSG